eukprot:TRINITY_DN77257_c0_g1_i1.p1 TRINITY_DN77257_c0_g1~~TRINITY_DN77257_c0_g1_i1.p1  ORF type:complete len:280 (+),score=93.76 TRINITY_DN77257_c0_g1_i1:3-842(+)
MMLWRRSLRLSRAQRHVAWRLVRRFGSVRTLRDEFVEEGFVVVERMVSRDVVERMREVYDRFLDGSIDVGDNRYDLGRLDDNAPGGEGAESIPQIMWPSDFVDGLVDSELHQNGLLIARQLLGEDMAFDFDMLIAKPPHSDDAVMPWHQDQAYWPDMPDKRAVSAWIALDASVPENGAMWFIPQSHLAPERKHVKAGPAANAPLKCDAEESEGVCISLEPGDATFHHGGTAHYSRGNSTSHVRRAYIINYRPAAMIEWEREHGFDHGRSASKSHNARDS